jgi:hypothetical protein
VCCTPLPVSEAASTSETSVNFYQTTRRNNPEDTHLHTLSRENLKSNLINLYGEATHRNIRRFEALIIALMMEAVNTSETSVNCYQTTRCNSTEDSHLLSYQYLFIPTILDYLMS